MKIKRLLGVIIFLALITTACSSNTKNTAQQDSTTVSATTAKQDRSIQVFGNVMYNDTENISIDFSAVVQKLLVKKGDIVKKDAALLSLDISDYENSIKDKEHEYELLKMNMSKQKVANDETQNELNQMVRDITTKKENLAKNTDMDIIKISNDLKYAEDVYAQGKQDLAHQQSLYDSTAISKSELDSFQKAVDEKKKNVDDLKLAHESAKYNKQKELDQLNTDKGQLAARLQGGQKDVETINENMKQTESEINLMKAKIDKSYLKSNTIISDVDNAIVTDVFYSVGDYIVPQQKIISLINLNSVFIQTDVPEEFIKSVKVGTEVTFSLQMDKSKQYKGKVAKISNIGVVKDAETIIPVEIIPEEINDLPMIPNANVDVTLNVGQ